MSIDKWTLESALDAAVDCLNRHLPGYIQTRLDADAERDRPLINGKLPVPKVVTTGMLDDLSADWVTPAIFVNATSTSYQNYNASSLLDSQPRVTATILMAEGDIDTSEQRIYSNALSMYSDGVRYILSTVFPEDGGCDVGVQAATPDSVQYSPLVRPDGYPVWLRWSEVSVVWTQRVVNSWNTDPPPFDPLTLGPSIWLDYTDRNYLFIDSVGTVPVLSPGDPIGLVVNKGTYGNAGNGVQSVSASRPVWSLADGGRAEFNGVNSVMTIEHRIANWGFSVATDLRANNGGHFIGIGANGDGYWSVTRTPSEIVGNRVAEVGQLSGNGFNIRAYKTGSSQPDRIASVAVYQTIGTSIATSSERVVSTFPITAPTPATNINNIRIGAVRLTSLFANMTLKHLFIFDRPLTATEQDKLIAWMEAQ